MKKRLFLLPLLAITLSACMPSGGGTDGPSVDGGGEGIDLGPAEYQGYKRVTKAPEAGKEYLIGMYQATLQKNMFYNGGCHTDSAGSYPFYLSCTEDVSKAAHVKVTYESDNKHFKIQDVGGGEKSLYTNQYLRVYEGLKKDGTLITSLSFYDGTAAGAAKDPDNDSHTVTHSEDKFYFLDKYDYRGESTTLNTFAADLETEGYNAQPVILGTYDEYISIGAITPNHFATNFLTFLWEKK